jgi:hypothetical protein
MFHVLPPFDENGNLPTGIHACSVDELVERFGHGSPEREVETDELLQLFDWCRRAGVWRVIVNGSFVTATESPNDVDVVILPGPDYPRDQSATDDEEIRWPFVQLLVAADDADLERWALEDFGTDRNRKPKGVVEVKL